jgi:hypothetical protein
MTLIIPPKYMEIDKPLIFLAGPIQGAYDWQSAAARIIYHLDPEKYIASPRRNFVNTQRLDPVIEEEQIDWETYHLRKAGKNGVVMFWLPKEYEHFCWRAYAQTSRFELSEWKLRHERDGAKIVVGMDEGFTGRSYIKRRFMQDCPDVQIQNTIEKTCEEALRLIKKENFI